MMMQTPYRPAAPEARLVMDRWAELKGERSQHEAMWEDIARLMRPERGNFSGTDNGGRTLEKPLSSGPILAQSNFSAGLYGMMTNPANRWFGFTTSDPDKARYHEHALWFDQITDRTLASFLPGNSSFYTATTQAYGDLTSFGNAVQYDELVSEERKILDVTISLAEVVFDIDGWGRVSEAVRRFMLTASAALKMFGRAALPPKIYDLAEKGSRDKIIFWHHVLQNDDFQAQRLGVKGKRWISRYACEVEQALVREAGYDEMPFFAPRWEVDTGQTYGIGPGFVALASARAHQLMEEATLRRTQYESDPTLLAPSKDDWPLAGKVRPGSVLYGGVNFQGNQMVHPLQLGSGFNLTLQEKQQKMEEIKDAFHYTLMSLAGRTGMTATEVMTITEERQRLWAPNQGRVQDEFLAPKIARRFALLWRAGQIPPPPKGLQGAAMEVTYLSAAAAAQRSGEGNNALRVLQDIAPLIQMMPRLGDRIDPDGMLEVLLAARGAPARMVRSREDADQIAQARAQAQQAAQTMGAMQAGAGMLKDVAGAAAQMAPQGQGAPA